MKSAQRKSILNLYVSPLLKSLFFLLFHAFTVFAQQYVMVQPQKSDGVYSLLRQYRLQPNNMAVDNFWQLNADLARKGRYLQLGQEYKLPLYRIYYDGISIQTSLGIDNRKLVKKIDLYNQLIYRDGLKKSYRDSKELWVPCNWVTKHAISGEPSIFPILGLRYEVVQAEDNVLRDHILYLDAGHGGPDPGAIGKRGTDLLYEDEYAYDITIRLARRLLQHGASIYLIVEDEDDGIRDDALLKSDHDEFYHKGIAISNDQYSRLSDRVEIINDLYDRNKLHTSKQILISLHVDSRSLSKRIDVFFYYQKNNLASERLAYTFLQKFDEKYAQNQPGRGYQGTAGIRDLYLLSEAKPTAVYIEVGNIKNKKDQDRLIIADNRQAIANWLCEGLIEATLSDF